MSHGNTGDCSLPDGMSLSDITFDLDTQMPPSPEERAKPIYNPDVEESQLAKWKPSLFATPKSSLKRPTKGKLTPGLRVKGTNTVKRCTQSSDRAARTGKRLKSTEPCTQATRLSDAETFLFDNLQLTTDQVHQWDQFQAEWNDMPWSPLAKAVGDALRALIKYLLLTCVTLSPTSVSEARDMFSSRTSSTLEMTKIMVKSWENFIKDSTRSNEPAANTGKTQSSCSPFTTSPASATYMPTTCAPIRKVGVVVPSSATYLRIDPADEVMTSIGCQLPTGEISSNIMWEQEGKYYTLKSAAIAGSQRVDVTVFPKDRLMTSTDPRQRWRLASSRLKVWLDGETPEGAELLALVLELQQKALRLISRQDDCQRGQGSST